MPKKNIEKKRLILHAGFHKTGTSALQEALHNDRKRLLQEESILYPECLESKMSAHHVFVERIKRHKKESGRFVTEFFRELNKKHSFNTALLSSEKLVEEFHPKWLEPVFRNFGFVTIVFYVRSQIELLESAYLQQVKQVGEGRSIEEYKAYTIELYDVLKWWMKELPEASYHIRLYDKSLIQTGGIVNDYYTTILGKPKTVHSLVRVNASLSPVVPAILRCFHFEMGDSLRRTEVIGWLSRHPLVQIETGFTLISPEFREYIAHKERKNNILLSGLLENGKIDLDSEKEAQTFLSPDVVLDILSKYGLVEELSKRFSIRYQGPPPRGNTFSRHY